MSRAGFYRWRNPVHEKAARPKPPLALSSSERSDVLDILHEDRFIDKAPQEIYAALLDEEKHYELVKKGLKRFSYRSTLAALFINLYLFICFFLGHRAGFNPLPTLLKNKKKTP